MRRQTLVAASSVLQRERTALRVMLQPLVDRRDDLTVGDLVGVGDLFDVLAEHDEPFTDDLKRSFDHAKEPLRDQFQPVLRGEYQLGDGQRPEPGRLDPYPLPGGERALAHQRLRRWSAQVGALKVGADQQNPPVEVRLTGIDLDQIILRAEAVDNAGTRRQMIKQLVLDELGVDADTRLMVEHSVRWRGTRRTVDVVFATSATARICPTTCCARSPIAGRW
ncbi:MAG: hypothetical protein ACRDJY_10240 [Thermoleophilaceae bacterium]